MFWKNRLSASSRHRPARALSFVAFAILLTAAMGFAAMSSCRSSAPASSAAAVSRTSGGPVFEDVSDTNLPDATRRGPSMEARAADFDGDGDLDLLIAKEKLPNVLLLNDGAGRFTDASGRLPRAWHDSEDIAVADFDRDGDLDAVVVSEDDEVPEYYLNDGTAHFTDAGDRLPVRAVTNAVAAGDVDGDGDVDLVFGSAGPEHLLLNDGHGRFVDASDGRLPLTGDVTQDVALGDVDEDGDLDLLVGNEDGNKLLLNDGRGVFTDATDRLPPPPSPEETRNADFGDVDGDGDLDVFFSNVRHLYAGSQSRLLVNDGRGRFTDETAARLPATPWSTMDGEFVDVDRDGDLDLVTTGFPRGSHPHLFLNDGHGRFSEASRDYFPSTLTAEGIEVEAADFNGDGRVDVYLADYRDPDYLLLARRDPLHTLAVASRRVSPRRR
jgi:hypothetical protein